MQTRNKIFDDISQLMTNAMGVAQGAKDEAEAAMKGVIDRWLADRDFVTREEFDAVRAMAQKAREENAALAARLQALEGKKSPAARKSPAKASGGTTGKSAGKTTAKTAAKTGAKTTARSGGTSSKKSGADKA